MLALSIIEESALNNCILLMNMFWVFVLVLMQGRKALRFMWGKTYRRLEVLKFVWGETYGRLEVLSLIKRTHLEHT